MFLIVDTSQSGPRIVLAGNSGELVAERRFDRALALSRQILEELELLFDQASFGLDDLRGVLCVTGPGHFTSIRIGVITANIFAFSRSIPIVGVLSGEEREGIEKLCRGKGVEFVLPTYDSPPDIRWNH